jgi:hypothetical protein
MLKGSKMPQEAIEKIRTALKGRKRTEEQKINMSLAHKGYHPVMEWKKGTSGFKGRKHSEESRGKISETRIQRIKEGKITRTTGFIGHHHTEESKKIISEKNKSRPLTEEERKEFLSST